MKLRAYNGFIALIVLAAPSFSSPQTPDCEEISSLEAATVLLHAIKEINLSGVDFGSLNVDTVCKRIEAANTRAYREIATFNFGFVDEFAHEATIKLLITKWTPYSRDPNYTVKVESSGAFPQDPPMLPRPIQSHMLSPQTTDK